MASPRTQVALAVFGLLALAAVAVVVLPESMSSIRAHQLPGAPQVPRAPELPSDELPSALPGESPVAAEPIEANLGTGGQSSAVRIYSPADRSVSLVEMTAGTGGLDVSVLGNVILTSPVTAPILVEGDLRFDDVVTFNLPSLDGKTYWIRVDRSTTPACIALSPTLAGALTPSAPDGPTATKDAPAPVPGQDAPRVPEAEDVGTICSFVGFVGEPANPTDIMVFNPEVHTLKEGTLFRYHDNGDGTSSVWYLDPQENKEVGPQRVRHEAVSMQGSPFEDAWTVRIQPEGQGPTTFYMPLDAVRSRFALGELPTQPYLEILRDALYDTDAYKAITDGTRTWAQGDLGGQRWLSGATDLTVFVDVPQAQLSGAPSVIMARDGAAASRTFPTERGETANGYVRHTATIPAAYLGSLADGSMVRFSVAYTVSAAKVVTEQLVDDNAGAGYRFKLDRVAPVASNVQVVPMDPEHPHRLTVTWSGRDAASGIRGYKVEWAVDGTWQGKPLAVGTDDTTTDFTGTRGKTYTFRVTPTDNVGIAGNAVSSSAVTIPAAGTGDAGANDAPTIQLLQPTGQEEFLGVPSLTIKWKASDPDGTTPVVNLYWSSDGGATWNDLASPRGSQYVWDITDLDPGADYRIKVEATDGALSNQDTSGKFRIDNAALGDASAIGGGKQAALPGAGAPGDGSGSAAQSPAALGVDTTMVVVLALVLIACAGAVAVWRFKTR